MPNRPRALTFLITSQVDLFNLMAIMSVFSSTKIDGKPAYSITILSAGNERNVPGANGLAVINCLPFSEYSGPIDTLVVFGSEEARKGWSPDLTLWLRKNASRAHRLVSVGSAVFMLASAGLLRGKRVTTHWHHVERLAKEHPQLRVERYPIFVKDGNVYSTAGAAAGIDMALALVEEDLGHPEAACVARDLVLFMRRSGNESQHSLLLAQQANVGGTRMRDLPVWAKTRIARKLDIGTLAKVVAMSPRTFARQFDLHFQTTPARWVQSLRIEAACLHLEAQELPLKAIAKLTGFRDEQALRRAFVQQRSMTPKQYRECFGCLVGADPTAAELHPSEPKLTVVTHALPIPSDNSLRNV